MARYAKVVLEIPVDREFYYRIPDDLAGVVGLGVRVHAPLQRRLVTGIVVSISGDCRLSSPKEIAAVVSPAPVAGRDIIELANWIADYYCCGISRAFRAVLPSCVREGRRARPLLVASLAASPEEAERIIEAAGRRAPKQAAILRRLIKAGAPVPVSKLLKATRGSSGSVKALERKGLIRISSRSCERIPFADDEVVPTAPLDLTDEQGRALESIASNGKLVTLIHGITGSGKTEVYLHAIARELAQGRGAIVLVPEISLTPQMVEMFMARFGREVAVLHSRLSEGERYDQWQRLARGDSRIAIGARSAVFAPVSNLGLIVVDEEHERTYKQEESPRYNARDVAVVRARICGAKVVLGSATPSLESYRNALTGKYNLARLTSRIDHRRLPDVHVVDMRREKSLVGRGIVFSRRLVDGVRSRLAAGEQVILFLNRRGFCTVLLCRGCGEALRCGNCSVSMTYHKKAGKMLCHICGERLSPPSICPKCGKGKLFLTGVGTQRVEATIAKLFPGARIQRMDTDSTSAKDAHRRILDEFRSGRINILVGTQMIAKGLDFPNVTLVGVVLADIALGLPDFRSSEHTFQLITQVAGRAGRGDVKGEVIIQTYSPNQPAIEAAARQDYEAFYRREIRDREELRYPPFTRFVLVLFQGRNEEMTFRVAALHFEEMKKALTGDVEVHGPVPCPIARARGKYRFQVVLKARRAAAAATLVREAISAIKQDRNVQVVVDVDPLSML